MRAKAVLCTCLCVVLLAAGPSTAAPQAPPDEVPVPTVTGPVPVSAASYPLLSAEGLAERGYVEREYFISGVARQYDGEDVAFTYPYRTRLVVRAPASARESSGTVVMEWYNVTGSFDQEWDWWTAGDYLTRAGHTWVGVSAQWVGVTDLRRWNPDRYGELDTGGDSYAFDIFSQAAAALRTPPDVDPLQGRRPELVIAAGHSQSGSRLAAYYNDLQPLHGLIDGFMLRGVDDEVRKDLPVPVIRVQTETELTEGGAPGDDDARWYRRWEVAGTSHVDWQNVRIRDGLATRDRGSPTPVRCTKPPYSRVPFAQALSAAYEHMDRWLRGGPPPPRAPRLRLDDLGNVMRDEAGNSLGGIRLPAHAAPLGVNTGNNVGVALCVLYGSHEPFDAATLRQRYGDHDGYVAAVKRATRRAVEAGFLLPADARATRFAARHAQLGLEH